MTPTDYLQNKSLSLSSRPKLGKEWTTGAIYTLPLSLLPLPSDSLFKINPSLQKLQLRTSLVSNESLLLSTLRLLILFLKIVNLYPEF
jgi:hypothetical protein